MALPKVHAALDAAMSSRDSTVVVMAHRLSTVRHADVIVVMDKGKVHEMGSYHELLARRGIYWQLVCRIDPTSAGPTDTDSESMLSAAAAAAAAGIGGGADAAAVAAALNASVPSSPGDSGDEMGSSNGRGASAAGHGNGNGNGNGRAALRVPYGSTASREEDVARKIGIGAATDNNDNSDDGNGHGGSGEARRGESCVP